MEIKTFASIAQVVICFFVSLILYFIHKREKLKVQKNLENVPEYDRGVFWLSAAIFLWGVAGLVTAVIQEDYLREFIRIVLSTINSVCLIIAVAYFDYAPSWLKSIQQDMKLHRPLIISASLVSVVLYVIIWLIFKTNINGLINSIDCIDIVLAVFTLYILWIGFEVSFKNRKFRNIIVLSRFAILLVIIAQFLDLNFLTNHFKMAFGFNLENLHWLSLLVSKALLLIIVLTHIISWKIEEEEELYTGEPRIKFFGRTSHKQWEVSIVIPSIRPKKMKITLTDALHRHLLWFAFLKKYYIEDEGYIYLLEMKSDDGRPSFKNQFDRIIEKILESYISKNTTEKEKVVLISKILKELFNQKNKAYQLKLNPQNIFVYSKDEFKKLVEYDEMLNYLLNKLSE